MAAALQRLPVFNIHCMAIYKYRCHCHRACQKCFLLKCKWAHRCESNWKIVLLNFSHGAVQNPPASCLLEINLVCRLVWSCVQFHRGRLCRFLITLLPEEKTSSSLDKIKDFDWWSMLSSRGCFSSLPVCWRTDEKGKLWTHNTQIYLRVFSSSMGISASINSALTLTWMKVVSLTKFC